jgi:TonB-dependent Receptor Plug Domain.
MYDYLRGRVPGVQVTADNRIIIRGIGTNSGNTDPLILVDGVEVTDLSTIDPAYVKSVDVIKDGSSAIYGMQGGNGVIIIKTVGASGND